MGGEMVMRHLISAFMIFLILGMASGCSVYMAGSQPGKKNLTLMNEGVHRDQIIAEFGKPISSTMKGEEKVETYKFVEGYSNWVKYGRAALHGTADVFTFFLWEFIGMPIEAGFDGEEMVYRVTYDNADRVSKIEVLQGEKPVAVGVPKTEPGPDQEQGKEPTEDNAVES
jgi:hypothetical protein